MFVYLTIKTIFLIIKIFFSLEMLTYLHKDEIGSILKEIEPLYIDKMFTLNKYFKSMDTNEFWRSYYFKWINPRFELVEEKEYPWKEKFFRNFSYPSQIIGGEVWSFKGGGFYKVINTTLTHFLLVPFFYTEIFDRERPGAKLTLTRYMNLYTTIFQNFYDKAKKVPMNIRIFGLHHQVLIKLPEDIMILTNKEELEKYYRRRGLYINISEYREVVKTFNCQIKIPEKHPLITILKKYP